MKRTISFYLRDIIENMTLAESFIRGLSEQDLEMDTKTLYAVLRSIEVIGEATKHVPQQTRESYPDIPWREMAGMRDKLIHNYLGVDRETVWLVLKERIPAIRPRIEKALQEIEQHERQLGE